MIQCQYQEIEPIDVLKCIVYQGVLMEESVLSLNTLSKVQIFTWQVETLIFSWKKILF